MNLAPPGIDRLVVKRTPRREPTFQIGFALPMTLFRAAGAMHRAVKGTDF